MSKRFKKTIVYPVFTKCAENCKDEFWKQLFEDLAFSKTPKNIIILSQQIVCTNGKKSFSKMCNSYDFSHKTYSQICEELIPFLQTNSSIFSTKDLKKKKKVIQDLKKELSEQNNQKWQQIKNNNLKKIMILDFVIDVKNKYNWEWSHTKNFLNYLLNYIKRQGSSKKIEVVEGKILSIEGISIERFELDSFGDFSKENKYKSLKKDTRWEVYIKKHLKLIDETIN